VKAIALPGADGGVFLDYLAYDATNHRVWVPAGGTARVDVIDAKTGDLTPIEGWPTKEMERRGHKFNVGPSAATVGDGVVYIGNRGDSSVCAVDAKTLAKKGCVMLDSSPDGLQYVAATHEVWVTTPRDRKIQIVDAKKPGELKVVGKVDFDGEPEGFAVDNKRRVFFTNLEDKDKTVVVDVAKRAVTKTWEPKCGEDGPKGLVFDDKANHLLVVCPASIEVLDVGKDGAQVSRLDVGDGLDAVAWIASKRLVFAAAGRAEKMVVASLPASGALATVSTVATAKGARNAVASDDGTAFVADGPAGRILMVPAQKK
jgi:DNA-binding beta-propeller fold protein YncE